MSFVYLVCLNEHVFFQKVRNQVICVLHSRSQNCSFDPLNGWYVFFFLFRTFPFTLFYSALQQMSDPAADCCSIQVKYDDLTIVTV